jgi:long-chain acyl-CoA synthetase
MKEIMSSSSPQSSILRVFDLIPFVKQMYPGKTVFCSRKDNRWIKYSASEYSDLVDFVSAALLHAGIKKGDTIISLTRNRAEFNFIDMGMLQIGAIHVAVYPNIDDEKFGKIIHETECKFIFTGSKALYKNALLQKTKASASFQIVSFDKVEGAYHFDDFLKEGKNNLDNDRLNSIKASIYPDDTASITYISGATTEIKGVELTHQHHISNFTSGTKPMGLHTGMNLISLLPLAHSYERSTNYGLQYLGVTVWYNDNFKNLTQELQEIRPDVLFMVPLMVQRIYYNLLIQQSSKMFFQKLFLKAAIKHGENFNPGKLPQNIFFHKLWDLLIFRQWRKITGGNLKIIYCGGAALKPNIHNAFHAAGMKLYEGYGITEAGPLVAYNNPKGYKSYSVGKPIDIASVKIAEDGEVMIKSYSVMKGYFKNPGATSKAIDAGGWLHTGDRGSIDTAGFLTLTGVKKQIFKLSSGLYADPGAIEKKLIQSEFISQAWVFGKNQDFLSAIIIPDFDFLKSWCIGKNIVITASANLLSVTDVSEVLIAEIKKYNESCQRPDKIIRFEFVMEKWSQLTGEINASGILNRDLLNEKYNGIFNKFYTSG